MDVFLFASLIGKRNYISVLNQFEIHQLEMKLWLTLSIFGCPASIPQSQSFLTPPSHPRITLCRTVPSCVFGIGGRAQISLWKLWGPDSPTRHPAKQGVPCGGTIPGTVRACGGCWFLRERPKGKGTSWSHSHQWQLLCECPEPALWLWLGSWLTCSWALWPWSGLESKLLLLWVPDIFPMHSLPLWEKSMYSFCSQPGMLPQLYRGSV